MRYLLQLAVSLCAALGITTSAHAALIDRDTYTLDSATSLLWLDVTSTVGYSYNEILSGAGGWLTSGWRYATGDEVRELAARYIGVPSEYWYGGEAYANALDVIRMLGVVISWNNTEGVVQRFQSGPLELVSTQGWFNDQTGGALAGLAELQARIVDNQPAPNITEHTRWVAYDDFQSADRWALSVGSFLVRPMPTPATIALLMIGAAAIAATQVRRPSP